MYIDKHLLLNPGNNRKINITDHALIIAQDEESILLVENFDVSKYLTLNSIKTGDKSVFLKHCVYVTGGEKIQRKFFTFLKGILFPPKIFRE